jgi:hypothetical protein
MHRPGLHPLTWVEWGRTLQWQNNPFKMTEKLKYSNINKNEENLVDQTLTTKNNSGILQDVIKG